MVLFPSTQEKMNRDKVQQRQTTKCTKETKIFCVLPVFRGSSIVLTILLLTAAISFGAQQQPPQTQAIFSVKSQLVQIFLTVQEGSRRITGLDLSKFSVAEDGKVQLIDHMDSEQVPLQVALLLDTSQSMTESLGETQETATLFVQSLKPGDRVTLIPFNSNLHMFPQLTNDFEPVVSAIRGTRAENKTKLYDAILYALKVLSDKRGAKRLRSSQTEKTRRARQRFPWLSMRRHVTVTRSTPSVPAWKPEVNPTVGYSSSLRKRTGEGHIMQRTSAISPRHFSMYPPSSGQRTCFITTQV